MGFVCFAECFAKRCSQHHFGIHPIAGNGHKIGFIVLEFVGTQLLQGSVNIDGIRTLWFSYHDPLISEGSRHGVGTSSRKCS